MGSSSDQRWWSSSFKFANGAAVSTLKDSQPYVDRAAMSARAIISTATEDRVGDILNPSGCKIANYSKNPVVLWGHGLEGISTPIGTSRDPSGQLSIIVGETEVTATCFFSQKSLEASQIFELIDEGIVRATSVRETPTKQRSTFKGGKQIQIVDEWDLEEWSWCAIGVNPDAVAKAMTRRIDGRKLSPSIMKSLNAIAPKKRTTGIGSDFKMADESDEKKPDDETPADEASESDDGKKEPGQQKYGSQLIQATHAAVGDVVKSVEEGLGPLEHEGAIKGMTKVHDTLKDCMTAMQGLHEKCYPGSSAMKSDDEDGGDDDSSDSDMKSFLMRAEFARLKASGIEGRLKSFSITERNLLPSQRQFLAGMADSIGRLNREAEESAKKSLKIIEASAAPLKPTPEQQAKLDEVFAKLNA